MTKIAVLVLDGIVPALKDPYGDFGDMGIEMFKQSSRAASYDFVKYDTFGKRELPSMAELKAGGFSAVYLTGSRCSSNDDIPFINDVKQLLEEIFAEQEKPGEFDLKVVGICFGHQIVARALGYTVEKNPAGWEMGVTPIELEGEFKADFSQRLAGKTALNISESHQDIVVRPANLKSGFSVVGATDICKCQGLYKRKGAITFQGHPEFPTDAVNKLISSRKETGSLDDAKAEEMLAKGRKYPNDSELITEIILDFIEQE